MVEEGAPTHEGAPAVAHAWVVPAVQLPPLGHCEEESTHCWELPPELPPHQKNDGELAQAAQVVKEEGVAAAQAGAPAVEHWDRVAAVQLAAGQ